jgi:chromosome segregation ATPase
VTVGGRGGRAASLVLAAGVGLFFSTGCQRMSLVGKTFTVLILLLSILFLGFSVMNFATQRNWKELVQGSGTEPGLQQQVNEAQRGLDERRNELQLVQRKIALETATRRSALAVLEVRARELQIRLQQAQTQYDELATEHRRNIDTLTAAQAEMQRLKSEVDQIRSDLQAAIARRDARFEQVLRLTDRLNQGEGTLRRLMERSEQLAGARAP